MRYRIGEDPATAALNVTDHTLMLSAALGLAIGIVLLWLGRRGRQLWLTSWSWGLIAASGAYMAWMLHRLG